MLLAQAFRERIEPYTGYEDIEDIKSIKYQKAPDTENTHHEIAVFSYPVLYDVIIMAANV